MKRSRLDGIANNFPGKDTNSLKAAVPWKELLSRSSEYVNSEYLPADVVLMDPSHLRAEVVNSILSFWYDRQARGKPVFRFKEVHPDIWVSSAGPLPLIPKPQLGRTQDKGHAGRSSDRRSSEEENGYASEYSDDEWVGGTSGLARRMEQRATVSKKAAGPGRSSKGCQYRDGSSLPGDRSEIRTKSRSKLPTPTTDRSTYSPEPSNGRKPAGKAKSTVKKNQLKKVILSLSPPKHGC